MITRRNFVKTTGVISLSLAGTGASASTLRESFTKTDKGPAIKKISIFTASGSFYRFIGPNSYDEKPKGILGGDGHKTVLIELSDGTTGIGTAGYSPLNNDALTEVKKLIGKDAFSLYQWSDDSITGVSVDSEKYVFNPAYSWVECALLDAIGKVRQIPVYRMFGESVKERIDPYDGTLYFADIAQNKGVEIIAQLGKRIKRDGYRAIKMKVGRPDKWMPGEAGVERDIEAFIALREAVGTNFTILTDANNGYKNKIDWALRFLKACAPYDMYFMEELIPDDTVQYRELIEALHAESLHIPIADGENIWSEDLLEIFEDYCQSGVYSYIQPDIPTCGFTNILRIARMAENYPHVKLIPHVWQSQMGLYMSNHIAKIQSNIPLVEDSRFNENVLLAPGYKFDQGQWIVPEEPGWGVSLTPGYKEFINKEIAVLQ